MDGNQRIVCWECFIQNYDIRTYNKRLLKRKSVA